MHTEKRIFSGVQPTGNLHLGNYLGAIVNWVKLQADYAEPIYGIMDLHAITVPQSPESLRNATYEVAASLLACGIDAKKSIIFAQSSVSAHAELGWILGCNTPLGWLNRMTQFKDKAGKNQDKSSLGLYAYPVLMSADVLAYKATHVPVGDDQKQHVELMRDIAGAFNRNYNIEYFPLPEPVIQPNAARIMSLRDGRKKMSKSDESDYSRINLTDDAETIELKIRKAKSDAIVGISYDTENRPEVTNLINIYSALSDISKEKIIAGFADKNFSDFKKSLAEVAISKLSPITLKMREYMQDRGYLEQILREGADRANEIAAKNLAEIKQIVGFL
ncbi:MAG: tryptophan--tRNA ligase [Pseudomonadota bacterium]